MSNKTYGPTWTKVSRLQTKTLHRTCLHACPSGLASRESGSLLLAHFRFLPHVLFAFAFTSVCVLLSHRAQLPRILASKSFHPLLPLPVQQKTASSPLQLQT